jgi:hypothetical protein
MARWVVVVGSVLLGVSVLGACGDGEDRPGSAFRVM